MSGTPGNCGQDEQQIFWDTHLTLCEADGLTVPESLKPAGFGRLEVENGTGTGGGGWCLWVYVPVDLFLLIRKL